MSLPERPILEQCFTQGNWPDAIVLALETVGKSKGKHELAQYLAAQWQAQHGGKDEGNVGLWIRQTALKAGIA